MLIGERERERERVDFLRSYSVLSSCFLISMEVSLPFHLILCISAISALLGVASASVFCPPQTVAFVSTFQWQCPLSLDRTSSCLGEFKGVSANGSISFSLIGG
ncbi:hypothetical protein CKAN_00620200 [Cinnamomum micranthum f. kanehirae]|uniref:Uncharacterized protein n=1 Tax=Cinnamomum micranthum f. kanehirae TaxID=337451 RepID=A0A443NGQ6_9MAGN|nr:hypothetical protein CKAN_00620200 [Cinnamomum micranthum f. kanehirae]